MQNAFLESAARGRNRWWRYLLTVVIVAVASQVGAAMGIGSAMALAAARGSQVTMDAATGRLVGIPPLTMYIVAHAAFVAALLALWACMRWVHGRSMKSLVTPDRRIDIARVLRAAAMLVGLSLLAAAFEELLHPGRYQVASDWRTWAFAVPFVLLLTPLQATVEELLFRGYALQGLSRLTVRTAPLLLFTSVPFMLGHAFNPEMRQAGWTIAAYYLVFGGVMALVTLRTKSLELAMGAHIGVNLSAALLVSYPSAVLETPALLRANTFDATYLGISGVIASLIFYFWATHTEAAFSGIGSEDVLARRAPA